MNIPWTHELTPDQRANPLLEVAQVDLPDDLIIPDDETLGQIFPGDGHQLKTWGRSTVGGKETRTFDPHWIGVRKGTPLHTDPAYPRYSHHLILRADSMWLWGMGKERVDISRGTYFVLDGHSPHQLCVDPAYPKDAPPPFYVAVSFDMPQEPGPMDAILPQLIKYAQDNPLDNRK